MNLRQIDAWSELIRLESGSGYEVVGGAITACAAAVVALVVGWWFENAPAVPAVLGFTLSIALGFFCTRRLRERRIRLLTSKLQGADFEMNPR